MPKKSTHNRSDFFVSSFQIEGLCNAIRLSVSMGAVPGPVAISILKSLRDKTVEVGSGHWKDNLPEVKGDMDPHDVLALAEILRTTILAFLSPEEVVEQLGAFGFHAAFERD